MQNPDLLRISETVSRLFSRAETMLPPETGMKIECAMDKPFETDEGKAALTGLLLYFVRCGLNGERLFPTTEEAVVYAACGTERHLSDADLTAAIEAGVESAYRDLPVSPASAIHIQQVPGAALHLTVQPRTGVASFARESTTGSSDTRALSAWIANQLRAQKDILSFPVFLGVGLSTTAEAAEQLADAALLRYIDVPNPDRELEALEGKILAESRHLGFGPNSLPGKQAVLAVCVNADTPLADAQFCAVKTAPALLRRAEAKL